MPNANEDAAFALSRNIVKTKYEDLPAEVVEITKKSILDTLGVIVGASTMGQGCQEIVDLVKKSGAKGKSTIIGFGGRVASWMAGFANGSMVHQLDYDDVGGAGHPSACIVPAAFAVAEEVGNVDGKQFITAVALSVDLNCRIGFALSKDKADRPNRGWFIAPLVGYFTAAATAGKLLGLREEGILDALGHSLQQAAGSQQVSYSPGSVFRGIRDGFPVMGGILSALMAKKGLPGTKDSLEGKFGLFNLYFRGKYERAVLLSELGKRFENTKVGFKPWPSCGLTHPAIDATLQILDKHDIPPQVIDEIIVSVGDRMSLQAESLESRMRPQTSIDAKDSIPFTLGVAATKRKVLIKDFTPLGLKNPAVLKLARKVKVKVNNRLKKTPYSTIVEIKVGDGKRYSKRVDVPYGRYANPIDTLDLVEKFRDCVSYSIKPLSKDTVNQVVEMITRLEDIKNIGKVIRLMA